MTDVLIYGEIGFEVNAQAVTEQLPDDGSPVTVRINSVGGEVYEGVSIMNTLRGYAGDVTVVVEGSALSIASVIAIGSGGRVVMRPHAELMIHDALIGFQGNAAEVMKIYQNLDRLSDSMATIYAEKAGGDPADWRVAMQAETWFSANEALEAGLVDAVEDARIPAATAMAIATAERGRSNTIPSTYKYQSRAAAPAPVVTPNLEPSDPDPGLDPNERNSMSILKHLAQEMNVEEDQMRTALHRYLNEEVNVNTTVDISYPENTTIVPTGKAVVNPVDTVPPGVVFAAGEAPEGWTVEVEETTGAATITAPSAVEPDTEVDIPVQVSGDDTAVDLNIHMTVQAAANDDESNPAAPAAPALDPAAPGAAASGAVVTVDVDTFRELQEAAKMGWEASKKQQEDRLRDEVDGWIRDGRISAALRAPAIKAMQVNPEDARTVYGSNPKNTIPRMEVGTSRAPVLNEDIDSNVKSTAELKGLAESRRSSK